MLKNLTNFKSLFNNLNGLENFETENVQLNTYNTKEPTEQKLFTPILMPYNFQSNDPIGDLFKTVNLDGTIIPPERISPKGRSNIIDSEASLITECPPGSKPVGEINVNSTYLKCKPDGSKMPIQTDRKFLSEKNSCVFKSKYSSAATSTLMPKSNNNIKSETDDKDMITRSANGSKVLTNVVPMNKSDISEVKSQKSVSASVRSSAKDKKMVNRSAKSKNALTTIMSDSGLSSSSLFSSDGSSSVGSILSSTSSKQSKSSDNSYKEAVKRAAGETFSVTEN